MNLQASVEIERDVLSGNNNVIVVTVTDEKERSQRFAVRVSHSIRVTDVGEFVQLLTYLSNREDSKNESLDAPIACSGFEAELESADCVPHSAHVKEQNEIAEDLLSRINLRLLPDAQRAAFLDPASGLISVVAKLIADYHSSLVKVDVCPPCSGVMPSDLDALPIAMRFKTTAVKPVSPSSLCVHDFLTALSTVRFVLAPAAGADPDAALLALRECIQGAVYGSMGAAAAEVRCPMHVWLEDPKPLQSGEPSFQFAVHVLQETRRQITQSLETSVKIPGVRFDLLENVSSASKLPSSVGDVDEFNDMLSVELNRAACGGAELLSRVDHVQRLQLLAVLGAARESLRDAGFVGVKFDLVGTQRKMDVVAEPGQYLSATHHCVPCDRHGAIVAFVAADNQLSSLWRLRTGDAGGADVLVDWLWRVNPSGVIEQWAHSVGLVCERLSVAKVFSVREKS